MILAFLAIIAGFAVLVWSADRFIEGAAGVALHIGMPSLLVGVIIVGFGTSAPEMVVSAMAALDGKVNLALGNAYGSNIVNTGLVLGVTALVAPIIVHSKIVRKELPILFLISIASGLILWGNTLSRIEAAGLLIGFFGLIIWSVISAMRNKEDALAVEKELQETVEPMPLKRAITLLLVGFVLLLTSSRVLVWGAVSVAEILGVSDLIIGLTIVALGTSLPELAASVAAIRKGQHDIAIGNVVGSNMFNLLGVVGIAGALSPTSQVSPEVLSRDWVVMMALLVSLFVLIVGFRKSGQINRIEGVLLLTAFVAYNVYLVMDALGG